MKTLLAISVLTILYGAVAINDKNARIAELEAISNYKVALVDKWNVHHMREGEMDNGVIKVRLKD